MTPLPADTPSTDIPDLCTVSGKGVWFLEPHRTVVDLDDVLWHLGGCGRYAGAVRWSVLQHTALCLRIFDALLVPVIGPARLTRRYVVAHDLHEGYVLDLPSGLKRRLPEYKTRIENPWEAHVHAALGLAWPVPLDVAAIVKQVDGLALVAEMTLLGHAFRDVAAHRRQVDPTTLPVLHSIAGQVSGRYEDELRSEVRAALDAA